MEMMDKIGETLAVKGKEAADKARDLAEIARLKGQIATCEEVRKKNYLEIGKLYYEKYQDEPGVEFEKQCRAVLNAEHGIEELKKKIELLKK